MTPLKHGIAYLGKGHAIMISTGKTGFVSTFLKLSTVSALTLTLSACEDFQGFSLGGNRDASAPQESTSTSFVERDVEAPEVFSVSEAGLWDGRPSLGGVWVAHPDVGDPERVIIRNKANGKFVIGALFRRERAIPGPRLQLSSDAAAALSVLAGQPVELDVTALRRESAPEAPEVSETIDPAAEVETETLDPVLAATAALDKVENAEAAASAPATAAAPAPTPTPQASSLEKPFIQIGIFSIESNADNAAAQMRNAGMVPTVKKQSSKGKTFWRVIVGPASNASERSALLKKIKATGFTDAYAVTN